MPQDDNENTKNVFFAAPEDLWEQAKELALKRRTTLAEICRDALREYLQSAKTAA